MLLLGHPQHHTMAHGHPRSGRSAAAATVAAAVCILLTINQPPPTVAEAAGRADVVLQHTVTVTEHPFALVITRYPSSERATLAAVSRAPASSASTAAAPPRPHLRRQLLDRFTAQSMAQMAAAREARDAADKLAPPTADEPSPPADGPSTASKYTGSIVPAVGPGRCCSPRHVRDAISLNVLKTQGFETRNTRR